ncbi:MAG: glycosyltransferase family 61 protein [Opitutales bacterium]|nr:glycosyltransferase family 61 protein [Opitutales bacterium]
MPSILPRPQWFRQRLKKHAESSYVINVEPYLRVFSQEWFAVTDDNILLPDSFVSTLDGRNSVYMGPYRKNGHQEMLLPEAQFVLEKPIYVLGGTNNYAHWVMDVLPRLQAWKANEELGKLPILTDEQKAGFYKEWLELLGVTSTQIIGLPYPSSAICMQAVYSSVRTDQRFGLPIRNKEQLQWLRAQLPLKNGPKARLLYITRGLNAPERRRIQNEDEVMDLVRKHGFEIHDTDGMNVKDQLEMFNEAKVILTVHGAALANTVAAQPGTCIIELVNDEHHRKYDDKTWFAHSSVLLGHNYIRVVGKAGDANTAGDDRPVNKVATYELEHIEKAIRESGR